MQPDQTVGQCLYCRGKLARRRVSYSGTRRGYHLIVDHVPAWVCEQCGEPLFDEAAVDAIQEMMSDIDRGVEKLTAIPAAA